MDLMPTTCRSLSATAEGRYPARGHRIFARLGPWVLPGWGSGFCPVGTLGFARLGLWVLPGWGSGDGMVSYHDVLASTTEGAVYYGHTPRHAGANDPDAGGPSEALFAIAYGRKAGRRERITTFKIFFDQHILVGQELQCRLVQL